MLKYYWLLVAVAVAEEHLLMLTAVAVAVLVEFFTLQDKLFMLELHIRR
jgi:hypothetical protein